MNRFVRGCAPILRRSLASVAVCQALLYAAPASAQTKIIDFHDFDDVGGVYGPAQGMPAGVTATFNGFAAWDGAIGGDKSPTSDEMSLFSEGSTASIVFTGGPVEVPLFYISRPSFGTPGGETAGDDVITGYRLGAPLFTHTPAVTTAGWKPITAGASFFIDELRFTKFTEGELDEVTVQVPEPGGVAVLTMLAITVSRRRRPSTAQN